MRASCEPHKTESAGTPTTRSAPHSSRRCRRRTVSPRRPLRVLEITTPYRPWCRPRSRTYASRRSTPSSTATVARAEHSSTWCSGVAGLPFAQRRQSRSSSRRVRKPTSRRSMRRASSAARRAPRHVPQSMPGWHSSQRHACEPLPTPSASRSASPPGCANSFRPQRHRAHGPDACASERREREARRRWYLFPTTENRRNRTFEARELIDAFTPLERQFASPAADPSRPGSARHTKIGDVERG